MDILTQIIGFIASLIYILSVQIKKKNEYLLAVILCNALFIVTFMLLNAYTGATTCLIATIETTIIYFLDKHKKKITNSLIISFMIVSLIGGILSYVNMYSIIATLASLLFVINITLKDMPKIRLITLIISVLWIIYDLFIGAYTVAISDIFTVISTIIAIIRYDLIKKRH